MQSRLFQPPTQPENRIIVNIVDHGPAHRARRRTRRRGSAPAGSRSAVTPYWLYGTHPVAAALANPGRRVHRLAATEGAGPAPEGARAETLTAAELRALLPPGAVHQGVAALVDPLPAPALDNVLAALAPSAGAVAVALDQVTDPRNVGAVLRSAAAFAAAAVLATGRHTPEEGGALAKAASGALETVPVVRPANLARALGRMKAAGFWIVGLDMSAPLTLGEAELPARSAFVLGAEGRGLRQLTRRCCDLAVRVPTAGVMESLNVSATAAVALYEWERQANIVPAISGPAAARAPRNRR